MGCQPHFYPPRHPPVAPRLNISQSINETMQPMPNAIGCIIFLEMYYII